MKAYEDTLYEQWKENVEHILPNLLRHNLLTKPARDSAVEGQITGIQHEGVPVEEEDGEAVSLHHCVTNYLHVYTTLKVH